MTLGIARLSRGPLIRPPFQSPLPTLRSYSATRSGDAYHIRTRSSGDKYMRSPGCTSNTS